MSGKQEKLYHKLPYPLKVAGLNLKALINYRKRFSKDFHFFLNEYNNLWFEELEVIKKYQKEQLKNLLLECYCYSKWYKTKFDEAGVSKGDIELNPFSVLERLPLLQKSERKEFVDEIMNQNKDRKTEAIGFTSGTSGSPTKDYLDAESIHRSFALWKRFHTTIGIKETVKQIRFSGRLIVNPKTTKPPFWIYNFFERQLFMSSYHLKEKNLPDYVKKIKHFKPKLIDGYPSSIYVIAKYINTNNIRLNFKPKAIAVTAETLYDYQRLEIEIAFGCQVFNQYASSEGSPFITECTSGNLHINLDSGFFEFINMKGSPAKPGEFAQLVVTSFRNLKTPLIRYNIGDTVLLPEHDSICPCGCKMPLVEKITGREDDILWTEEKGFVGRMDTAYKGLEGIVKSQIIQNTPKDFVINNIVNSKYSQMIEKKLIHNLKERLGDQTNFKINIVEEIPLGANGKFDAVKRNFKLN
ncbi:phenylacetate--CoA ligase family protein [Gaetbulibacter aestuarii]|uniref:Phenylacetate--CoA ligase family protein n=1 Tax=Gaetbulibacter aestuarii TaxID=1502358 RepID=A0ABW7N0U0_9FLAO